MAYHRLSRQSLGKGKTKEAQREGETIGCRVSASILYKRGSLSFSALLTSGHFKGNLVFVLIRKANNRIMHFLKI